MSATDFKTTLLVDQTPAEVFAAVTNVRGWWSEEIEGGTAKLNDEFTYHFEDVHRSRFKLTEVIPNEKVVWLCLENYFKFTADEKEWTGDQMVFEILKEEGKTRLTFTQVGLNSEYECFDICQNAWTNYIQNSLYKLITTGRGEPNAKGTARTKDEEKFLSGEK